MQSGTVMATPEKPQKTLADEIRDAEKPFVEAGTKACRQRLISEYRRLRAYAIESGTDVVSLRLILTCNFASSCPIVSVTSVPEFVPATGKTEVPFR